LKYLETTLMTGTAIGNTRILHHLWWPEPIAFEITSPIIAKRYREFFYELWKKN